MTHLKLRYQDGKFVPTEPVAGLADGDEIEVEWKLSTRDDTICAMLDRTRGLWADWEGAAGLLEDARQKWEQEWQNRASSL